MSRHRHERSSWIIGLSTASAGAIEWCYQCGAFRRLRQGSSGIAPDGPWAKPSGHGGPNPWSKYQRAQDAYRRREVDWRRYVR